MAARGDNVALLTRLKSDGSDYDFVFMEDGPGWLNGEDQNIFHTQVGTEKCFYIRDVRLLNWDMNNLYTYGPKLILHSEHKTCFWSL